MTLHVSPLRIALVSSVLPSNTSAGPLILCRHLSSPSFDFSEPSNSRSPSHPYVICRRITPLFKAFGFSRLAESTLLHMGGRWHLSSPTAFEAAPDIVLTVAHGDLCFAAIRFAALLRRPLVTIYHDWWPDIPKVFRFTRNYLEASFRRLYDASDLALCVSPGMMKALGPHRNSHVLYPIPSGRIPHVAQDSIGFPASKRRYRIFYFGNLGDYSDLILDLLVHCEDHPFLRFEVRGNDPPWPLDLKRRFYSKGTLLPFASRDEFEIWVSQADAFLVPQSFELPLSRRMETSFPSKIPEMVQHGKPIVVWAPVYSSAAVWTRETSSGLLVSSRNPRDVVRALEDLARSSLLQTRLMLASRRSANCEFNPSLIQDTFERLLFSLVARNDSSSAAF